MTISNALEPYATTNTVNTELAKKANKSHTHTVSQITDMPNAVLSVNNITPASGGNVNLGLHAVATSGNYNDLRNKPSMPATPKAYITKTWRNGSQWYRKWSDGFIEQSGTFRDTDYTDVTLNTPFSTTTYAVFLSSTVAADELRLAFTKSKTSTFRAIGLSSSAYDYYWYACGY